MIYQRRGNSHHMRDREIRLAPIHHEAHDDLGLLLKFVLGVAVGIGLVVWWIA